MYEQGSWNGAQEKAKRMMKAYIHPFKQGARLPAENKMALLLGVSRATIRSVLDELEAEGIVVRYHGRGTYLNPVYAKVKAKLYPAQSIDRSIANCGYKPSAKYLGDSVEMASEEIAKAIQIEPGDQVVVSKTLMYADDHFCALCIDYIDKRLIDKQSINRLRTQNSAIFQLLFEKTARTVAWDLAQFSVTDTTQMPELGRFAELQLHQVKPFLVMRTTEYDKDYHPLFHAEFFIDTDYIQYGILSRKKVDMKTVSSETYKKDSAKKEITG